jgi:hypothetical protein
LVIRVVNLPTNSSVDPIFFLPSITDNMKSMSIGARTLVAALPYACSAAGIYTNGVWAHRTGALRWHTAIPILSTGVMWCLVILSGQHLALVVLFFCLAGLLGKSAAAAAVGIISLANVGGFVGPYFFGWLTTTTGHYEAGLWLLAGCMLMAGVLATGIRVPRVTRQAANRP